MFEAQGCLLIRKEVQHTQDSGHASNILLALDRSSELVIGDVASMACWAIRCPLADAYSSLNAIEYLSDS